MKYMFCILTLSMHGLNALTQLEYACVETTPVEITLDSTSHLELAKLLFYFSDDPAVRKVTQSSGTPKGMCHEVYTFAHTQIRDACKEQFVGLNTHKDPRYYIACKEMQGSKPGIQLDVYYDPKAVVCCADQYDTITQHKLFALRLIDKKLINELSERDTPLIQMAQYHPIAYYRKTSCFLLEKCVIL